MWILAMLGTLLLAGCASAGDKAGSNITIVNDRTAVARCQALGQIQTDSLWGGFAMTGAAYNDAMGKLKAEAARRGGSHVLMVNSSNTMGGTNMIGDAYRCG